MKMAFDEALAAAFLSAGARRPYLSSGLASMVRRTGNVGTLAVTRDGVLIIDKKVFDRWSPHVVGEIITHEFMHLLRKHADRSDMFHGLDRKMWNQAADAEINDDLDSRLVEEGNGTTAAKLGIPDGKMAEEYYAILRERAKKENEGDGDGDGDGKGEGKGQGKAKGGGNGDGEGDGKGEPAAGSGKCGSGAGGEQSQEEMEAAADAQKRSEADLNRMRKQTAEAIKSAAQQNMGSVPAGMRRWAEGQLKPPVVRWQDKLKRSLRASIACVAGKTDYTRGHLARRQAQFANITRKLGGLPYLVPALTSHLPLVGIGIDTSGSMGADQLLEAASESKAIMQALGAPVVFLSCDTEATVPIKVNNISQLLANLKGGGGTDFRPVFKAVSDLKPKPDIFIFLTDGIGPAPDSAPAGYETIWVFIGPYQRPPVQWGKQISIPYNDNKEIRR
jgi:predicted metal-dependent peptidase